jgi:predicted Mrr-cat superfamily restriction endonuclease
MSTNEAKVWGVFVGDSGDQLETFNTKNGPFPPEPGSEGYIAIGWPAIGDMRLYQDNYSDYVDKFRIVYPDNNERSFKTTANMPWNFAFKMKAGDWVMCPSSASGYLLVGKVEGDYVPNFHRNKLLPRSDIRADFMHLRKVKWLYVVSKKDTRYEKLHRIGQLTVVQPDISSADLQKILNGAA